MTDYQPRIKAGRCCNGAERDGGRVVHAVEGNAWRALCGTEPGRTSAGWGEWVRPAVTCPRCLKAIAKLEATAAPDAGAAN